MIPDKECCSQYLVKIVIPVYKVDLNIYETVSLNQAVNVFKNYTKTIIKPTNLDVKVILDKYENQFDIQNFDDDYFTDLVGYNRLMLSPEFYRRFGDSKYILIYQLDAFVFRDELAYWCSLNYDYIGAPWLCKRKYQRLWMKLFLRVRGSIYSILKIKHRQQCFYKVGNGGFSLRKTDSCYKITVTKQKLIRYYLQHVRESSQYNEDVFWGIEASKDDNFLLPSWSEALGFSFDLFPEICFQLSEGHLPFGCHRWYKELKFWHKYIAIN